MYQAAIKNIASTLTADQKQGLYKAFRSELETCLAEFDRGPDTATHWSITIEDVDNHWEFVLDFLVEYAGDDSDPDVAVLEMLEVRLAD